MTLAALLAQLRTALGWSQEKLAEVAGVSVRAISDLERGLTRRPQHGTLTALADALGLTGPDRDRLVQAGRQAPPANTRRRPPVPVTRASIIGRGPDIAGVTTLLRRPEVRLVTITGPAGVGKSRLAAEAAARVAGGFDRIHLNVLPAPAGGTRDLWILDDFDDDPAITAELAAALRRSRHLTVLVTSRAPVRLRGEHRWPLAPLPLPAPSPGSGRVPAGPDLDVLAANPAVAVLVDRARAVRPGFALTADNAVAIVSLCRRLDGLPLALELAAAQLRTWDPGDLCDALVAHHGPGLRDLVAVVIGRLPPDCRRVLATLVAVRGGADPGDLAGDHVDASLSALAAAGLVSVVDRGGRPWVDVLPATREIAAELLF